jgi:hypothetical protein
MRLSFQTIVPKSKFEKVTEILINFEERELPSLNRLQTRITRLFATYPIKLNWLKSTVNNQGQIETRMFCYVTQNTLTGSYIDVVQFLTDVRPTLERYLRGEQLSRSLD